MKVVWPLDRSMNLMTATQLAQSKLWTIHPRGNKGETLTWVQALFILSFSLTCGIQSWEWQKEMGVVRKEEREPDTKAVKSCVCIQNLDIVSDWLNSNLIESSFSVLTGSWFVLTQSCSQSVQVNSGCCWENIQSSRDNFDLAVYRS